MHPMPFSAAIYICADCSVEHNGSAQRLLGMDPANDIGQCRSAARSVFPETLATRYGELARRWQGRATAMEGLSTRLDALADDDALGEDVAAPTAQALRDRAAGIRDHFEDFPADLMRAEFIKCHARPQARLWAELLASGGAQVAAPQVLPAALPGTLYEIRIRPAPGPLQDLHQPAVWAHLHLQAPTPANRLADITMADLAAGHLKSDADRRLGPTWQAQQRQAGREDVHIHRSPVDAGLLALLLGRGGDSD